MQNKTKIYLNRLYYACFFSEMARGRVPKCSSTDKSFRAKSIEQRDRWKAEDYITRYIYINSATLKYCMSNKSCPILQSEWLHEKWTRLIGHTIIMLTAFLQSIDNLTKHVLYKQYGGGHSEPCFSKIPL